MVPFRCVLQPFGAYSLANELAHSLENERSATFCSRFATLCIKFDALLLRPAVIGARFSAFCINLVPLRCVLQRFDAHSLEHELVI